MTLIHQKDNLLSHKTNFFKHPKDNFHLKCTYLYENIYKFRLSWSKMINFMLRKDI